MNFPHAKDMCQLANGQSYPFAESIADKIKAHSKLGVTTLSVVIPRECNLVEEKAIVVALRKQGYYVDRERDCHGVYYLYIQWSYVC